MGADKAQKVGRFFVERHCTVLARVLAGRLQTPRRAVRALFKGRICDAKPDGSALQTRRQPATSNNPPRRALCDSVCNGSQGQERALAPVLTPENIRPELNLTGVDKSLISG